MKTSTLRDQSLSGAVAAKANEMTIINRTQR
jgi:hypothetical protein